MGPMRLMIMMLLVNLQMHAAHNNTAQNELDAALCDIRIVINNNLEAVQSLIARGANINARDFMQMTLLHRAAMYHCERIVCYCLQKIDVNATDSYGWTPLHYACISDRCDLVEILLAHGADMTLKDKIGRVPLDIAKTRNCSAVIECLNNWKDFPDIKGAIIQESSST